MQNRLSAIAILVVILAICCLGFYVAITGFFNSNPPEFLANLRSTLPIFTPVPVVLPTDTPAPSETATLNSVSATVRSITSTRLPVASTVTVSTVVPTSRPAPSTPLPTAAPPTVCGGFQFCNLGGPPDQTIMAPPSGCPSDRIWGRVYDLTGKGIPERKVRFKDPQGELGSTTTKNTPDIVGKYDIPSNVPSSQWIVWLLGDDGNPISPQVTIMTQNYTGSGNCPNRIDFKQR